MSIRYSIFKAFTEISIRVGEWKVVIEDGFLFGWFPFVLSCLCTTIASLFQCLGSNYFQVLI